MKKIFCIILTTCFLFSTSINVFAEEPIGQSEVLVEDVQFSSEELIPLDEKEAMQLLKLNEKQLEGKTVYEIKPRANYNGYIPSVLNSGDVAYQDLSITNSFTGAIHKINANHFQFGVGITSGTAQLLIGVYCTDSTWNGDAIYYDSFKNGNSYISELFETTAGRDHYFKFYVISGTDDVLPMQFRFILGAV